VDEAGALGEVVGGFSVTTHDFDFRPGGTWRLTMHGPQGDFPNAIVYDEIIRPERIVFTHDLGFRATVTFVEEGGKTRVTLRQLYRSAAERDAVVEKYGAIEGGKQTLERLAEHLAVKA
jgi:uncharacterized protein YndB with AHSA1/START domain